MSAFEQIDSEETRVMSDFVLNYWLAVAPVFLVGLYLLSVLKRWRAEKARQAERRAPATIEIERR
jgi:hypothetical protein